MTAVEKVGVSARQSLRMSLTQVLLRCLVNKVPSRANFRRTAAIGAGSRGQEVWIGSVRIPSSMIG